MVDLIDFLGGMEDFYDKICGKWMFLLPLQFPTKKHF